MSIIIILSFMYVYKNIVYVAAVNVYTHMYAFN